MKCELDGQLLWFFHGIIELNFHWTVSFNFQWNVTEFFWKIKRVWKSFRFQVSLNALRMRIFIATLLSCLKDFRLYAHVLLGETCFLKCEKGFWGCILSFILMIPPVTWCFLSERGSKGHLVLTELVGVPLPPSVSFITGYEGFPAYNFGPNANVGRLTQYFVPEPFFMDFAIIVTVKPSNSRGGVLFAITDPSQRIVHLGLALTPVEDKTQRIVLYYSEPGLADTMEVASFKVPDMAQQWNRFTLTVEHEEVRLYMDCEEYHSAPLKRSLQPLSFKQGSGIFVANAGSTGLERFVVGHHFTFFQISKTFS